MDRQDSLSRHKKPKAERTKKEEIPRFASFRRNDDHSAKDRESGQHNAVQDGTRSKSRSRKRRRLSGDNVTARESRKARDGASLPLNPWQQNLEEVNRLCSFDSEGDPSILAYSGLNHYAIPKYSRFGAGSLIGCPRSQKIDRSSSNDKGLVIGLDRRDQPNTRDTNGLRKTARLGTPDFMIKSQAHNDSVLDGTADFIQLDCAPSVRKSRAEDHSKSNQLSLDSDNCRYKSIEGKVSEQDRHPDNDFQYRRRTPPVQRKNNSTQRAESLSGDRRRVFSQRVDADPEDLEAWLGLLSCQDRTIGCLIHTQPEKYSNAEVKISIFEEALLHVRNQKARERLLLGLMQEAAIVWDTVKLSTRWKSVLEANPDYLSLWTRYLDFEQTNFLDFRYEAVLKVYLDCLEVLRHAGNKVAPGDAKESRLFEIHVHVLLRMTLFMREAGFAEHGIATWQALLEFEFFRPCRFETEVPNSSLYSKHDIAISFEDFWESEVARIGEDGSKGWAHFDEKRGEPLSSKIPTAKVKEPSSNAFAAWLAFERQQSLRSHEPARTSDEAAEDDPCRVILYADVQFFCITAPNPPSRHILLNAFLAFCHLPQYQTETAMQEPSSWWTDGYIRNQLLYQHGQHGESPFDFFMWNYRIDEDTLFADSEKWFSAFSDAQHSSSAEVHKPVTEAWCLCALKALAASNAVGDAFAEYCLAFELKVSPSTVRNTAKSLLKKEPSSLRLYKVYAILEYRFGNAISGENVLITALNMSKQLSDHQRGSISLWRTWIRELLSIGKNAEAFQRLLSFADKRLFAGNADCLVGERPGGNSTLITRTETSFITIHDEFLSRGLHRSAASAAECIMMLKYLQDPSTLAPANAVFNSHVDRYSTYSQEHLHQSFAHLIHHHATHTKLVKPAQIRSLLTQSINAFPGNTIFLSLYAWNETRFRFDDRVRSIIRDVVLTPHSDSRADRSVTSHFFAIHTELSRGTDFGSNTNTIRTTFERAVGSEAGAHCAGLWKAYFLFERSNQHMQKARAIFYRGVKACPWVKEIYMLAFECMRDTEGGLSEIELKGVYDLMGEKELRLHGDLDKLIKAREG